MNKLPTPNSQLPTPNSQLPTPNSQLPTPNSKLPTPHSQLLTPNSKLLTQKMQSTATTPDQYIAELPKERIETMSQLRKAIIKNIPKGFEEAMGYGMLGFVVPHSIYPDGYHCDPKSPLPFMAIASQKNFIAVYHMGIYMDPKLMKWFVEEYPKHCKAKLDMGKSCIRFKKMDQVPVKLIAELASKMTVKDWISKYESVLKSK